MVVSAAKSFINLLLTHWDWVFQIRGAKIKPVPQNCPAGWFSSTPVKYTRPKNLGIGTWWPNWHITAASFVCMGLFRPLFSFTSEGFPLLLPKPALPKLCREQCSQRLPLLSFHGVTCQQLCLLWTARLRIWVGSAPCFGSSDRTVSVTACAS